MSFEVRNYPKDSWDSILFGQLSDGKTAPLMMRDNGDGTYSIYTTATMIGSREIQVETGEWAGDGEYVTDVGVSFRLCNITISYSSPVTGDVEIWLDSAKGSNYDVPIDTFENSNDISNAQDFGDGWVFELGDEIKLAGDIGAATAYCRVVIELL